MVLPRLYAEEAVRRIQLREVEQHLLARVSAGDDLDGTPVNVAKIITSNDAYRDQINNINFLRDQELKQLKKESLADDQVTDEVSVRRASRAIKPSFDELVAVCRTVDVDDLAPHAPLRSLSSAHRPVSRVLWFL
jgi:hypothetical protein